VVPNAPATARGQTGDGGERDTLIDLSTSRLGSTVQTIVLFALASLAPAGVLMLTAFVRISVVLTLLRQALGSPQVPGNQVMMALSLLLTALVMRPQAEIVYEGAIRPLLEHRLSPQEAWQAASGPIQDFMIAQIYRAGHEHYLADLYEYAQPPSLSPEVRTPPGPERVSPLLQPTTSPGQPRPIVAEDLPFGVVASAFLLSELNTALVIGFAIYLPFLVIDLLVSSVLAAMGLIMLPPSLVAPPLKLIVFVLAGGWWLVAETLLRSFQLSTLTP
jgi:flagellar biosynthetic protein FliP